MSIQLIQPKHVFTQWSLRVNWSNRLEIRGMFTLSIHACWKSPSRVDVGKDQRVDQVRLANYTNELSSKWLEILRESSHQKLVCKKSKFYKIQGMSTLLIHAACCMQWDKEHLIVFTVYVNTVDTNNTQYTITFLWSFVSTISTCPLMYTQQIRWQWWQWVASSLSSSK